MSVRIDLTGKSLLVVGASSGLGRAIGLEAARAGARVALAARRLERLEEAAAEAGPEAIAIRCDVTDASDCRSVVERTAGTFGGLDGFVYATGMSPLAMLEEASQEEWRAVLDTNLIGASLVTAAALPHLRRARGRAVYLSSYAVRRCLPGLGLYRASKVALDGMIEGWRTEHPDVDFTRIVVGNTLGSEFADAWPAERRDRIIRIWFERNLLPAPTAMPPRSLAEAVLSVFAITGYVDDLAVMPRQTDPPAGSEV